MKQLSDLIASAVKNVYDQDVEVVLTRPDEQFGDFATNVALQLAGRLGKSPREIAEAIAGYLQSELIEKTEVAGPGFINITLTGVALKALAETEPSMILAGNKYIVEYSDPNPFDTR